MENETVEVPKQKIKLSVNLDKMKFGELELFEEVTGRTLDDLVRMKPVIDDVTGKYVPDPDDPKGRPLMQAEMTSKALMAMVLIAMRREDKSVTLDDVREMGMDDVDMGVEVNADPKAESDESTPNESATSD